MAYDPININGRIVDTIAIAFDDLDYPSTTAAATPETAQAGDFFPAGIAGPGHRRNLRVTRTTGKSRRHLDIRVQTHYRGWASVIKTRTQIRLGCRTQHVSRMSTVDRRHITGRTSHRHSGTFTKHQRVCTYSWHQPDPNPDAIGRDDEQVFLHLARMLRD